MMTQTIANFKKTFTNVRHAAILFGTSAKGLSPNSVVVKITTLTHVGENLMNVPKKYFESSNKVR